MSNINDTTLRQFDALNNWLGDVYGEETNYSTLLIDAGFSQAEIEQIKQAHLGEFLQAVMDVMAEYPIDERCKYVTLHHYGFINGKPQDFYEIGQNVGVCGERIRQIVSQAARKYRKPEQQAIVRADFVAIARQLLDTANN